MRLSAPAALFAGLLFAACSGSNGNTDGGPDSGMVCQSARDCATIDPSQCGGSKTCVCSNSVCIPLCQTNADCTGGNVCIEAACVPPGCGGNSDCSGGNVCVGGACTAPTAATAIHSCVIAPDSVAVRQGSTVQLSAVAQDSSGNAVPFTGTQWSIVSGPATIDASSGLVTGGAATAGASQQAVAKATISATVSCTANVNVYGTESANTSLRVVVIDEDTKVPVTGAYVVLDANTGSPQTTAADGSVVFTVAAGSGAHNVTAMAANHDYATYIGVTQTDLMIPLRQFYPIANRSAFDGSISATDFNSLTELNQLVHIAFYGSGIAGSLLDFTLDDFIGTQRDVPINVAGNSFTLPGAPGGLVLGLGDTLFTSPNADGGTSSYSMYADPGKRILWGIGGNLDLSTLLSVATPIISGGGTPDIGTLLPELLPLLGNLEFGDQVGVEAGASGSPPAANTTDSLPIDTPMHMNVAIKSPNLPTFNGTYVDGVVAVTGASAFPLGFTPLGITAGLAATDSNMVKTGAINDPTCTSSTAGACATNTLPMKVAARNHGLESYPYGAVLVALNFGALTSSTNSTIAVSGMMQTQDTITFSGGSAAPTTVDMSATPFMKLPGSANSVTYSKASRTVAITSDADSNTQIYKFTLQSSTHQTWSVYMPPAGASGSSAVLINPTDVNASLVDLQADASAAGWLSAIQTTSSSNNYGSLTGFGNVTVDALGNNLKAFAVQTVTLGN